jgi:hypothetical protein
MSVGQCLIDDKTCPVSPGMAKKIIADVGRDVAAASPGSASNPAGAVRSDRGEWHRAISGKLLVYINTTGGYRRKDCTWLYADGSFRTNSQDGSVSSLGTSASAGGGRGSWGTRGSVLTLAHGDGRQEVYTMSYGDNGSLFLDHWRYFLVEHDDSACQ